jgi:hypothetical protein
MDAKRSTFGRANIKTWAEGNVGINRTGYDH